MATSDLAVLDSPAATRSFTLHVASGTLPAFT